MEFLLWCLCGTMNFTVRKVVCSISNPLSSKGTACLVWHPIFRFTNLCRAEATSIGSGGCSQFLWRAYDKYTALCVFFLLSVLFSPCSWNWPSRIISSTHKRPNKTDDISLFTHVVCDWIVKCYLPGSSWRTWYAHSSFPDPRSSSSGRVTFRVFDRALHCFPEMNTKPFWLAPFWSTRILTHDLTVTSHIPCPEFSF